MEIVQGIPENIQIAEYARGEQECIVIATPVNFDNIQLVAEILPDEAIQVKNNKIYCCSSYQDLTRILVWLFMCIMFVVFIVFVGYIVCVCLILVFNIEWNIMNYSVEKQLGIYFGIGAVLNITGCLFVNRNKLQQ